MNEDSYYNDILSFVFSSTIMKNTKEGNVYFKLKPKSDLKYVLYCYKGTAKNCSLSIKRIFDWYFWSRLMLQNFLTYPWAYP